MNSDWLPDNVANNKLTNEKVGSIRSALSQSLTTVCNPHSIEFYKEKKKGKDIK